MDQKQVTQSAQSVPSTHVNQQGGSEAETQPMHYQSTRDRISELYNDILSLNMCRRTDYIPSQAEIDEFTQLLNNMFEFGSFSAGLAYASRLIRHCFANVRGDDRPTSVPEMVKAGSGCGPLLMGASPIDISTHYGLNGRVFLKKDEEGYYYGTPFRERTGYKAQANSYAKARRTDKRDNREKHDVRDTRVAKSSGPDRDARYPQPANGYENKEQAAWKPSSEESKTNRTTRRAAVKKEKDAIKKAKREQSKAGDLTTADVSVSDSAEPVSNPVAFPVKILKREKPVNALKQGVSFADAITKPPNFTHTNPFELDSVASTGTDSDTASGINVDEYANEVIAQTA